MHSGNQCKCPSPWHWAFFLSAALGKIMPKYPGRGRFGLLRSQKASTLWLSAEAKAITQLADASSTRYSLCDVTNSLGPYVPRPHCSDGMDHDQGRMPRPCDAVGPATITQQSKSPAKCWCLAYCTNGLRSHSGPDGFSSSLGQ
jgi:hypothetical protein